MKQKPISNEELETLRKNIKGVFRIDTIATYPNNNTHLEAYLEYYIGMNILYNSDPLILRYEDNKGILSKNNKWVVVATESHMFDYNKEFSKLQDAVDYAYQSYIDYCQKEIDNVREILK